jgi:hypothetical protein
MDLTKSASLLAIAFFMVFSAQAQFEKGNKTLRGRGYFSSAFIDSGVDTSKSHHIRVYPDLGVFIKDKLVFGVEMGMDWQKYLYLGKTTSTAFHLAISSYEIMAIGRKGGFLFARRPWYWLYQ